MKRQRERYGKILGKISAYLAECDTTAAMATLNAGENFCFDIDGTNVELSIDDLLIETVQKEGLFSESDQDVTVVLDCNLTEALIEES